MNLYSNDIRLAVQHLRDGGVILYPTDTVWGLGCDARNSDAVAKIFRLKHRSDAKALITLVGNLAQLERTVSGIPEVAYDLIQLSERPLTIVYDGIRPGSGISPALLAADGTIGVRLTREDFSSALCTAFGAPLVSTSANISGMPAPATFAQIDETLIDAVDYVCTSRRDETKAATPSTIMRLTEGGIFKILRQ